MKKTIIYLATFILVQLMAGGAASVILRLWFPTVSASSPEVIIAIIAFCSVFTAALFIALRWCPVSRNYIRTRPWATLLWSAMLGIGMLIPLTWLEEQIPESWMINLMQDEMQQMLRSTEGYFAICMLAPLMEEVVFRGAIIRALREWLLKRCSATSAQWWAICVSAVCFACAHFNPAQIPHALIVGVLLGWLFVKTGSIVPGLIIHWVNNSMAYVMANLFPTLPADAHLAEYVGGSQTAVLQAVLCSLLIALPSLYQLIRLNNKQDSRPSVIA